MDIENIVNIDVEPSVDTSGEINVETEKVGPAGASAYQIAVKNGYIGTEEQWLASLKGDTGATGQNGVDGIDGKSLEFNWNNTNLGIRQEGQSEYQYQDLKGNVGPAGRDGAIQYTAGDNITIENNVISATGGDLSNYLAKDNTTSYTPSGDYNPATKKYVDDKIEEPIAYVWDLTPKGRILNIWSGSAGLTNDEKTWFSNIITEYKTKHNTLAGLQIIVKVNTNGQSIGTLTWTGGSSTNLGESFILYTNNDYSIQLALTVINGSWSNDVFTCTATAISFKPNNNTKFFTYDYIVKKDTATTITGKYTYNTLPESSVTPTTNDQLVNKSYVDSAISTAITTTLGGSF